MSITTLRGVFPEPRPAFRRNFIKENVKQIKQMQGLTRAQAGSTSDTKSRIKSQTGKLTENVHLPLENLKILEAPKKDRDDISKIQFDKQKLTSRSTQTERLEDLSKLYESGVIKYPTGTQLKKPSNKKEVKRIYEAPKPVILPDEIPESPECLSASEKEKVHDYVKENMNVKPKGIRSHHGVRTANQPPPNYQIGAVPKYLKDRKGICEKVGAMGDSEPECPAGHILLPEEERKETLRVLRQSYADRIQELNSLPVRSDTLKIRKRKTDLEEELKKIDEGIKVFQRPKVFVKINA